MMLCLSENDILNAVTTTEIVAAVEGAMHIYESNKFLQPDRMHIDYNGDMLLLMPAFAGGKFGTKLVSVFPKNNETNKPVVMGTMLLNDGKTGETLAMMNGTVLTALRTGAVGSVGLRHLTPHNVTRVGVIGAGVQGIQQAFFASCVRDITDIYIYDLDALQTASAIRILTEKRPGINYHAAATTEELLENSQAVITATTSHRPVLPDEPALLEGKHFIGVGSFRPDMREFPRALYSLVKRVLVDTRHAVAESGDLSVPLEKGWIGREQVFSMGQWIKWMKAKEPPGENETTLFKSVGMALFDITTATIIYERALQKGLGTEIDL